MITSIDQILRTGAPWPPSEEIARLKRYRDYEALFDNDHELVWDADVWQRITREDIKAAVMIAINLPQALTMLFRNLLLGETPSVTTDEEEQERLELLLEETDFWQKVKQATIDVSRAGDGLMKVRRDDAGRIKVTAYPPCYWFPVMNPLDITEVQYHVLAWTVEIPMGASQTRKELRCEIHGKGMVESRIYNVDEAIGDLRDKRIEKNDVGDFLLFHIPNLQTTGKVYGVSDYRNITPIVQEMEVRLSQIAKILDQHASPKMYGPSSSVRPDDNGNLVADYGDYIPVEEGEAPPGYIVNTQAQLEQAYEEIKTLLNLFYITTQTCADAFQATDTGNAPSGTSLKLRLANPLAKAGDLRGNFDKPLVRAIKAMAKLSGFELKNVAIGWKDGLPDDEVARDRRYNENHIAGTISLERLLRERDGLEGDALTEEIERIKAASEVPVTVPKVRLEDE